MEGGEGEGRARAERASQYHKEATEESACRTNRAGRHEPAGMSVQGREGMARQATKTKRGRHCTKTRAEGGRRRRLMLGIILPPTEPARTGCKADRMQRVNSRNVIARIVANERRAATHRKKALRRSPAMPDAGTPASNESARTGSTAQQMSTHASRLTLERPNDK
eukprot:4832143-Pleurochrysis_carterae.AAC.2